MLGEVGSDEFCIVPADSPTRGEVHAFSTAKWGDGYRFPNESGIGTVTLSTATRNEERAGECGAHVGKDELPHAG